jgi:hypothetical protein
VSVACPHCGEPAPKTAVAGRAYACPRCKNPVLATEAVASKEAPPPAPRSGDGADAGASGGGEPSHPRWAIGVLAFVVLGLAYVGVYLLLTAAARRDRAAILMRYGESVREAEEPGAPPDRGPGLAEWEAKRTRYVDRQRLEALDGQVRTLFVAMMGAFALQTVLTVVIVFRARARTVAATRGSSRRRTSSPGAPGP